MTQMVTDATPILLDWADQAAQWLTDFDPATIGSQIQNWGATLVGDVMAFDYAGALNELAASITGYVATIDWSGVQAGLESLKTTVVNGITGIDWGGALATAGDMATKLRDGVFNGITTAITGINWEGLSVNFAGFIDSVSAGITDIDWSSISAGSVFAALVAPVTAGILAIDWVFNNESFGKLTGAITDAWGKIDWGTIGASFSGLTAEIQKKLGEAASAGLNDLAVKFQAGFEKWKWPKIADFQWSEWIEKLTWPAIPDFGWSEFSKT